MSPTGRPAKAPKAWRTTSILWVALALTTACDRTGAPEPCTLVGASFDAAGPDDRHLGLGHFLEQQGLRDWRVLAVSGARTSELASQLADAESRCVVIGLSISLVEDPQALLALLESSLPGLEQPWLMQYPPADRLRTPFRFEDYGGDAAAYNDARSALVELAMRYNTPLIDAWQDMRPVADGLHPDAASARRAAQRVEAALGALARP